MFDRIDHVGIAVENLADAVQLYEGVLGMPVVHRERVESQGVNAVLLDVGDGHIELLEPLDSETPVGKFLESRGPGMHHVAYAVPDVQAALSQLSAAGLELIDETPRIGIRGSEVAFVHPKATGGTLIEIVKPAEEH